MRGTERTAELVLQLNGIVGKTNVLTADDATRAYSTGYRFGSGTAALVVRPGTLVEMWRVVSACVAADHIVIAQAANTGLTGGSTPNGSYDRPVVLLSTTRISGIHLLRGGKQVVCLPGTTLHELEKTLAPFDREPHSVIGSSCIGASVVGGVCNNSGGALVRRGPAYTEYALYAVVDERGVLSLRNRLGLDLGNDPESILRRLDRGPVDDACIVDDQRRASASDYDSRVRDVEAETPARFNADPERLFEASGSAGRVVVFAVRLDTFEVDDRTATFYVGTDNPDELGELRKRMLRDSTVLPIAAEYIHRDAFDVAARYGKDVFLAVRFLGTSRLPKLYALRRRVDAFASRHAVLPTNLSDRLLQFVSALFPRHLPRRMTDYRDRFEHHLILKVANRGIEEARALLTELLPSASGDFFECTPTEADGAFQHRFAVAGAAVRYRAVHPDEVEDIIALDVALPRNERHWREMLPEPLSRDVIKALYYGHFFCHVFHQDYIVRSGVDVHALEARMLELLDARNAEYPAEHNVGHLYRAKTPLAKHYRDLDPTNSLNPGIGHTSRERNWA